MAATGPLCPVSWKRSLAPATSQMRTVPSSPADATILPSGLKHTARTQLVWPVILATGRPDEASQMRMQLS